MTKSNQLVIDKIMKTVTRIMNKFYDSGFETDAVVNTVYNKALSYSIDFCKEKKIDVSDSMGELDLIKELKDKFQNGDFK